MYWQALRQYLHSKGRHEAELISAGILAGVWGVWLLLPFNTFGSSPTYRPMAAVGPEHVWALVMLLVALIQSWAVVVEDRRLRFVGALLSAAAHAFIAAMFGLGNPPGIGMPTYVILALANLWVIRGLSR